MTHWTDVLANVALVEFVLLAVLTTAQWARRRIRGGNWIALSFVILGGLSLTVKIDPGLISDQHVAKYLLALLLLMPYCLFRFAAAFRTPSMGVRILAFAMTVGVIVFTFVLPYIPVRSTPAPPHFLAYRICILVAVGLLFGYVVIRFAVAAHAEPPIAAWRMRLTAIATTGLGVQVVVSALRVHGLTIRLGALAITVAMGAIFLVALAIPSFVRALLSRREDLAFGQAVGQLVAAGDSEDVAGHLLPHVCALMGASEAALLASDGTVVARYPLWSESERPDLWGDDTALGHGRGGITVRTTSGATHALAVKVSPYMPYFGSEELHQLDQLAQMVGLAIERCAMAEQMAFQASHDGLTGLANRALFMERLEEALSHVGRRRASLAVLLIELHRLKHVNDRGDHTAGDLLLNEMANRLMAMTRGVDVVARFGGDEFVAFAEVDHEEDAWDMAERIRRGLSAPLILGEARLVVTASIGVVITTDASTTSAGLLRDADNAMYEAKRSGRDQVVVYERRARDDAKRRWGLPGVPTSRLSVG